VEPEETQTYQHKSTSGNQTAHSQCQPQPEDIRLTSGTLGTYFSPGESVVPEDLQPLAGYATHDKSLIAVAAKNRMYPYLSPTKKLLGIDADQTPDGIDAYMVDPNETLSLSVGKSLSTRLFTSASIEVVAGQSGGILVVETFLSPTSPIVESVYQFNLKPNENRVLQFGGLRFARMEFSVAKGSFAIVAGQKTKWNLATAPTGAFIAFRFANGEKYAWNGLIGESNLKERQNEETEKAKAPLSLTNAYIKVYGNSDADHTQILASIGPGNQGFGVASDKEPANQKNLINPGEFLVLEAGDKLPAGARFSGGRLVLHNHSKKEIAMQLVTTEAGSEIESITYQIPAETALPVAFTTTRSFDRIRISSTGPASVGSDFFSYSKLYLCL